MRLWKADKETEMLTEEPLVVSIDGVSTRVAPGETATPLPYELLYRLRKP